MDLTPTELYLLKWLRFYHEIYSMVEDKPTEEVIRDDYLLDCWYEQRLEHVKSMVEEQRRTLSKMKSHSVSDQSSHSYTRQVKFAMATTNT